MKKKLLTRETGKQKILLFGSNGMLGHKILQNLPIEFDTADPSESVKNSEIYVFVPS